MTEHVFERDENRPDEQRHRFQTQFGVREMTDSEAADLQSQGLMVNRVSDDTEAVDSRGEALATANAILDAPRVAAEVDARTDEERAAQARETELAKLDEVSTSVDPTATPAEQAEAENPAEESKTAEDTGKTTSTRKR